MTDRSKVIVGIAVCLSPSGCGKDCPYYNDRKNRCKKQLRHDALELLKDKETEYQPVCRDYFPVPGSDDNYKTRWACKKCGYYVNSNFTPGFKYCPECGRCVK